eukprot:CAMPEP_0197630134 /NCGR_PEP_ID=MMETSP1338-20131121/7717_1 /TAXON_ID=43686 ORGANISM="Pelagodinium beii, Strain RCC1491" /NCGR_SAMPLE_ID=MMETSP1338 /ASSEMBLY_ACC=CAM_ASM_000754 /LENGTH=337 /DNA_ID=CAMNT_0043201287 /DNA_START=65 /DNA_END=1078 /DNA_ORIENTATION=-
MTDDSTWQAALQAVIIGLMYIGISATLIAFNKYMMYPGRFSHASILTTSHMAVTFGMSLLLYKLCPSLYPTMPKAKEKWRSVLSYIAPLGALFAVALVCSNQAYKYSSVAFLQFCKQGNVALVFSMSCFIGLQRFSWEKVGVLTVVVTGCSLCAHGEINFVLMGFLLQIASQLMECSKNLISEVVMSGEGGLKLDVLTFVLFQAPLSLLPLAVMASYDWNEEVKNDLLRMWPLLLANSLIAFFLNVLIALTLKKLSALAFVIIGLLKDIVIVASSGLFFGDPISSSQQMGFTITIIGIALWSRLKMQEQARKSEEAAEKEAILPQHLKKDEAAPKTL